MNISKLQDGTIDLSKRILTAGALSAVIALTTTYLGSYSGVAQAQPQITTQQEEAAHPQLVRAIREMNGALRDLNAAGHDFGGNKPAAMNDIRRAVFSVKKALYYRLKLDDAAIDRAQQ